jgi:phosphoglycolate phosphatase
MAPLVVGFDLDMTLVDSRPGIRASCDALARETATFIDTELVLSRLGPPLEVELAHWFPADLVPTMATRYREIYARLGVPGTLAMPGAHDALAAVRRASGTTLVVTAKETAGARACVAHVGLDVDVVEGLAWGAAKGDVLARHGGRVFVGDSPHDMLGARAAGALAIGVMTGPHDAHELRDAGADAILASLHEFPGWLDASANA